jgi:hypothetical protein
MPESKVVRTPGWRFNGMDGPLVDFVCRPREMSWAVFLHPVSDRIITNAPACTAVAPLKKEDKRFWIHLRDEHHATLLERHTFGVSYPRWKW